MEFANSNDTYFIRAADDGVGDRANDRPSAPKLVELLSQQMGGRLEVRCEGGFAVAVSVPAAGPAENQLQATAGGA